MRNQSVMKPLKKCMYRSLFHFFYKTAIFQFYRDFSKILLNLFCKLLMFYRRGQELSTFEVDSCAGFLKPL